MKLAARGELVERLPEISRALSRLMKEGDPGLLLEQCLPRNSSWELNLVSATLTAKWLGIVPMEKLPEVFRQ
jgi:hypothetical protein